MPSAIAARLRLPGGGLWRHRDFLNLWSAETISQFGTQVSLLAVPTVAILLLGASAFEVALLGTIEFLPFILFTLPAGVWVDRLRRRPVLIVGDLGRAVSLLSIPVAYALGVLSIYQLYVVGFVNGVLTVFFDVAWQSYLPSLVDRDQIVEGNSKLEITRSGSQIGGPALAGYLIQVVGAAWAIVADALSFLGSALFVLRIRKQEAVPVGNAHRDAQTRPGMRTEVMEGLRYVLRHPYLRPIAACTGSSNLFTNLVFAIYLVYAYRELALDPAVVGLVFAVGNIGYLAGALLSGWLPRRFGVGPTIVGGALLFGPSALLVPLAPRDNPVPFLIASGAVGAFGSVVYNVNQVSLRQAITPGRMQGRMNATMRFIVWGTIPVGSLLGGVLGSAIGLLPTLWIGALGCLVPILPVVFSPVRSLRRIPEPEADETLTRDAIPSVPEERTTIASGPVATREGR
ncbi:MAG: MFS transporter [Chloroflexota bacterium]|nr:MFS transporter [Chloroflexota bacterium]